MCSCQGFLYSICSVLGQLRGRHSIHPALILLISSFRKIKPNLKVLVLKIAEYKAFDVFYFHCFGQFEEPHFLNALNNSSKYF